MSKQTSELKMYEIGAYEARIRLGTLLDNVDAGAGYVISKHHRNMAVLVPYELWLQRTLGDRSVEAQELDRLVRELRHRHEQTQAALDEAFAEIASTRELLATMRAEREAERADAHHNQQRGPDAGGG
ncbi:type II toxin-antitoxin system Phd/YefM family antitoxin [Arhodomonas sp. SL1]|uniref:type II toxin-antitoxin system Phd/YefM family antitoxin n=1 Tax=Arhodomonas sp. SL1 TaxID=3425691 RepID=UPI003F8805D1